MAKAWGGAGAWAADAEEAEKEAEEHAIAKAVQKAKLFDEEEAFPTLGAAVAQKPKKKKEKGKQTLSLSELVTGKYIGPGGRSRTDDVPEDIIYHLPKGPRPKEEGEEELAGGLGGGFKDYGGNRNRGGFRDRDDRKEDDDMMMPSRADESRDWGSDRKFTPSGPRDTGRSFGGGGFGERDGDRRAGGRDSDRGREDLGPSRADEMDNWGAAKKFVPTSAPAPGRRGDDGWRPGSGSSDADNRDWSAAKKFVPSTGPTRFDAGGGADGDRWSRREAPPARDAGLRSSERPKLALAPRSKPVESPPPELAADSQDGDAQKLKQTKSNPFGAARPREEVLQEKGQDWKKLDDEVEKKGKAGSPATSVDGGSRPSTPPVKHKPKVNPFGDAKPREVLLEQKGQDWRKMEAELEHKAVERPETEEEIKLKKEIEKLTAVVKAQQAAEGGNGEGEGKEVKGEEQSEESKEAVNGEPDVVEAKTLAEKLLSPVELLAKKEKELELLRRTLDDKIRFPRGRGATRNLEPAHGRERSRELERPGSSGSTGRPSSEGPGRERFRKDNDWGSRGSDRRPNGGEVASRGGRW